MAYGLAGLAGQSVVRRGFFLGQVPYIRRVQGTKFLLQILDILFKSLDSLLLGNDNIIKLPDRLLLLHEMKLYVDQA